MRGLGLGFGFQRGSRAWFESSTFDLMAAGADFNGDRYFLPAQSSELTPSGVWTAGNGATVSGTGATLTSSGGNGYGSGRKTIGAVAVGDIYIVTLDVSQMTGTYSVFLRDTTTPGSGTLAAANYPGTTGSFLYVLTVTTAAASADLHIEAVNNTGATITATLSVKKQNLTKTAGKYPKRAATFAEWFAYTASSTAARTYTDVGGVLQSMAAADVPRFTYANGKRQLRLEDQRLNYYGASLTPVLQWAVVSGAGAVTVSPLADPMGTFTAARIATGGFGQSNWPLNADTLTTTISVYVRKNQGTCQFLGGATNIGGETRDLNTVTGALTNVTGTLGTWVVVDAGQWWRVGWTYTNVNTTGTEYYRITNGSGFTDVALPQREYGAFMSDYIPNATGASGVTRAIETAQFSPLMEALLGRSAASIVVRARLNKVGRGDLIGGVNYTSPLSATSTELSGTNLNGSDLNLSSAQAPPVGWNLLSFGAAIGVDGTGRSLTLNGSPVASDTNALAFGGMSPSYLARRGTQDVFYGDGYYDFVGYSPERQSNAQLQALAVPA